MLNEKETEKYMEAGRIVAGIREEFLKKIKPGDRLLSIAEEIEKQIIAAGAKPAFPVNISVNEVAAHFTPQAGDTRTVGEDDLVKIDVGAHIDGYIADLAFTWSKRPHPLVEASGKALEAGIKAIRPGVAVSEVSRAIYGAIQKSGFGPIVNLTGHSIGRYDFHGTFTIPNIENNSSYVLEEGDVVALEPFVCGTAGRVDESGPVEIYQFVQKRPVRSMEARKILELAEKDFGGLPFARRWLSGSFMPLKLSMALIELERTNAIRSYPVLKDMGGRKIAQSEDTIIVARKPIVTTR